MRKTAVYKKVEILSTDDWQQPSVKHNEVVMEAILSGYYNYQNKMSMYLTWYLGQYFI